MGQQRPLAGGADAGDLVLRRRVGRDDLAHVRPVGAERGGDGIADRHEHPQEHVCDDAGPERESGRGERESHQPYGRSQM